MKKQLLNKLSFISLIVFSLILALATKTFAEDMTKVDLNKIPKSAEEINPIKVGDKIPEATLSLVTGQQVKMTKVLNNKPALIIFYRGGWWPYCNTQLGQLHTIEKELKEIGFQIIGISPDKSEKLKESIEKNKLNYTLLSDSKMLAASAFGLAFKLDDKTLSALSSYGIDIEDASGETHHLLPVPAAFVVSASGVVSYSYVNSDYKTRVDAEKLLEEARKLSKDKL